MAQAFISCVVMRCVPVRARRTGAELGLGGTHLLLSHTSTVPAWLPAPTKCNPGQSFAADPVKGIWGAGKSEGCLDWNKERVGGSLSFSKADKGDRTHRK